MSTSNSRIRVMDSSIQFRSDADERCHRVECSDALALPVSRPASTPNRKLNNALMRARGHPADLWATAIVPREEAREAIEMRLGWSVEPGVNPFAVQRANERLRLPARLLPFTVDGLPSDEPGLQSRMVPQLAPKHAARPV